MLFLLLITEMQDSTKWVYMKKERAKLAQVSFQKAAESMKKQSHLSGVFHSHQHSRTASNKYCFQRLYLEVESHQGASQFISVTSN